MFDLLDDGYYKLPTEPPMWEKSSGTLGNFILPATDDNKYLSLFNVITGTGIHTVKKNFNEIQSDILKNLFNDDRKTNPYYTFICSTTENNIVPLIKKYMFETPEGENKEFIDMRLLFFVKHNNESYNPKFPENLYVKKMLRGGACEILDGDEFNTMVGISDQDPTRANIYDGFMWITNKIDLTKYGQHQVHSSWMVNELILKKSTVSATAAFSIGDDYYDELNDETPEQVAKEVYKPIPPANDISDSDSDEL